jgi:hypothetical protein
MDQTSLFRKVALERMSSPEQLDQFPYMTDAKSWLALIHWWLAAPFTVF